MFNTYINTLPQLNFYDYQYTQQRHFTEEVIYNAHCTVPEKHIFLVLFARAYSMLKHAIYSMYRALILYKSLVI